MFTGQFLSSVRSRALRRGVWFKALDTLERGILTLASRVVDKVESAVLGVEIVKILKKLTDAMKSGFVRRMEEYGAIRAKKLVAQAAEWGSGIASEWASDIGLIRYLTLIDMNRPSGFGI
jgi:hypothetical protein